MDDLDYKFEETRIPTEEELEANSDIWSANQAPMLSKYVSQDAFQFSSTAIRRGISNIMPANLVPLAKNLCTDVLDVIFNHFEGNVHIDSGYRSAEVNALVGGVSTSQHCRGEAADIIVPGITVEDLYQTIKSGEINVEFDQLIEELGSWVHISYSKGQNRHECFRTAYKDGKVVYITD